MASQQRTPPPSPTGAAGDHGMGSGAAHVQPGETEDVDVFGTFDPPPAHLTGEEWNMIFQCIGAPHGKEFVELDIDRAQISFSNLFEIKGKLGYSWRDFLYYKKRCGRDTASLVAIDFNHQIEPMIANSVREKKIRLLLTKDKQSTMQVSITPLKRPRHLPISDEPPTEEPITAYKNWLARLQHDQPDTEFKDDYRDETIKTYTEWLRREGYLPEILSYLDQHSNDVEILPDEESLDSRPSPPTDWPSHARRQNQKRNVNDLVGESSQGRNKARRGTLKGLSAATKRIKSGSQKLQIQFLSRLGGPTGPNARTFVDEVVVFTRKRAPLIGVQTWKDIDQNVKNSIALDVLNRWDFGNTENQKEKIWAIANERYKGWRSTFSSTYKAYNSYAARMKHKPEDVDIVEWHYLMLYFGSEDFQKVSSRNSENREKQQTKHRAGSKSFSNISYEKRDPEIGEEPNDIALWLSTHTKDGEWSDEASKDVYDDACNKIAEREVNMGVLSLSGEEENNLFQKSYKESTGCKTSKLHGHGYLSKNPTRSQLLNAQFQEQARATAAANQKNVELQGEVQDLKEQLSEKDRIFEEKLQQFQDEESKKREALREELRAELLSVLAEQRQAALPQTNTESIVPSDNNAATPTEENSYQKTRSSNVSRSLFPNSKANGPGPFISSQQLINAASSKRARTRSQQDK